MNRIIQYWRNMPQGAKASIAFIVSSFLIKGITFLITPVFTRILNMEQYGLVATYNSWVSILEVFALLGMTSAGIFNVGLNEHKEDRNQFISSTLFLCNIITILVFIILLILKIPFGKDFILPTNLLVIMFINFLFNPAQIFWVTRQRYEYKYKMAFLVTVLSSLFSQIVAVIVILKLERDTNVLGQIKIWSTNLALLVFEIPIYFKLIIDGKVLFNRNNWKNILIFALPLLPHYLAQHIMSSSDRIMISNLDSSMGTAIYSVVSNISMITTIIWSAINTSLIPYTFENLEKKNEKVINKVVIPLLLFYAMMCVIITLIAPEILMLLATREYYGGIYAIPPIAATAFMTALYNIYANIEFYHKKSWWIALATIIASSTNVCLNYLLIPKFGYIAAAYTTLISHIILIVMHYKGYQKFHKLKIYNDRFILFICICTIIGCLLCNLLYINYYIRYTLLVVFIVLLILKRNYFISRFISIRKN